MEQLHHHLKQRSAWYRFWHDEPHHQLLHWAILILVSSLFAALLILRLSGSPLQSRPSDAAAESVTLRPGESKVVRDVQVTYNMPVIRKFFIISAKPSFTFSRAGRTAIVGLGNGQSVRLFDDTVQATNIGQGKNSAVTLEILITTPTVETFLDRGWDPGMRSRRAATINPAGAGYYENCPDGISGKCYPSIAAGGGFYTLSPSMNEGDNVPCKINTGERFRVPGSAYGQFEPCPYYFSWSSDPAGRLSAVLTADSRSWSRTDTPNIYLGLQQNTPFGGLYMGANNMPNINEAYFEAYMQGSTEGVRTDEGAFGRFMTGLAWYVPSLQKSFVVEFNLDSFNTTQPQLSTTLEAVDNPSCGEAVKCLYLGARFWRVPSIMTSTPTKVSIDWAATVRTLVDRGYLPAEAWGSYPVSVFHSGPEMFGRGKLVDKISGAAIKAKVSQ